VNGLGLGFGDWGQEVKGFMVRVQGLGVGVSGDPSRFEGEGSDLRTTTSLKCAAVPRRARIRLIDFCITKL